MPGFMSGKLGAFLRNDAENGKKEPREEKEVSEKKEKRKYKKAKPLGRDKRSKKTDAQQKLHDANLAAQGVLNNAS